MKAAALIATALVVLAAGAHADAQKDFVMGFALGLEAKIGNPMTCISDAMQVSPKCKNVKSMHDVGFPDCMAAVKTALVDCGIKGITVDRVTDMLERPVAYLEARARLLIGNKEIAEDMSAAKASCNDPKQASACGAAVGKLVGMLVANPNPKPTDTSDGAWLKYLALLAASVLAAAAIYHIAVSTFAFVRELIEPVAKLLLIVALWVFLILVVNKLDTVGADLSVLSNDFVADVGRVVSDATSFFN